MLKFLEGLKTKRSNNQKIQVFRIMSSGGYRSLAEIEEELVKSMFPGACLFLFKMIQVFRLPDYKTVSNGNWKSKAEHVATSKTPFDWIVKECHQ